QPVTLDFALRVVPPGDGVPTGTVTLYDTFNGVTSVLSVAVLGGSAPPIPPLAAGTHVLTVVYSGDGNFNGSTSAPVTQIINRADTMTTVISSLNPAVVGQPVTIPATVTRLAPGGGTPTGTLTLYDTFDGVTSLLGTVTLGGPEQMIPPLQVGEHLITVVYSGDDNFNASISDPLVQVILPTP